MWGSMLDKVIQLIDAQKEGNFEIIRDYVEDRWSTVREISITILAENSNRDNLELMLKKTEDQNSSVQLAAIHGLSKICTHEDISLLKKLMASQKRLEIKNEINILIRHLKK